MRVCLPNPANKVGASYFQSSIFEFGNVATAHVHSLSHFLLSQPGSQSHFPQIRSYLHMRIFHPPTFCIGTVPHRNTKFCLKIVKLRCNQLPNAQLLFSCSRIQESSVSLEKKIRRLTRKCGISFSRTIVYMVSA